jgi:hypothetical protein
MSVEIGFPLEFIVAGTPVSLQTKRRESLDEWKGRVIAASQTALPEGHFATNDPLAITLYYFPNSEMQGDIDNIVKPILDALGGHIYIDDRQIQRILIQKFEPGNVFSSTQPSRMLGNVLEQPKPALYVRLSDDPFEDLV